MTLSGTAALKHAVSKATVWTYPRKVVFDYLREKVGITEAALSEREVMKVVALSKPTRLRADEPLSRIMKHDIGVVAEALRSLDASYDPNYLLTLTEDVNSFLERELDAKTPRLLKLSLVDRYPHPYEKMTAAAWSLSEFESELLGIPQGVYLRRDQLFPCSAENILGHEYAHATIVDMPNYVPWFDEGLADILGYAYYATRFGKVEDLRVWINYRNELKQYGAWYREYDRLVAVLILTCGMDVVRALVRLKRNEPKRVDWTGLATAIRTNPTYDRVRRCVEGELPAAGNAPELYATIAALFSSADIVYTVSPEAFCVILNLIGGGREARSGSAFRGVKKGLWKKTEKELFAHNLVYRHGDTLGIFGGTVVGSEELFTSNLVRADFSGRSLRSLG
jgi:hypothetical protein